MNESLKLLFDENIGKPVVEVFERIVAFQKEKVEIKHVRDFSFVGVYDEVWIPQVAAANWIVITSDRGKGGVAKGEKLPVICRRHNVTHVMLSNKLHHKNGFYKIRAILIAWDDLKRLPEEDKGSGWLLRMTTDKSAYLERKDLEFTPTKK